MNYVIWHTKLWSFKLFKNVFVVNWHILISMYLVSQAESVMQGKFVNCQAYHFLLNQKRNLAWNKSQLGSMRTVLIAVGTHSISPEGTRLRSGGLLWRVEDMVRRRFCYLFGYEEIKRRTCCLVLLKNSSSNFNEVGTCCWLTEYRVLQSKKVMNATVVHMLNSFLKSFSGIEESIQPSLVGDYLVGLLL